MKGLPIKLATITITLMVITVGCSQTPTPLPTMGAPVTIFPTGTFSGTGVNSTWSWDLNSDGSYYSSGTHATERGTYTLTGNQITVKGDYCGDVKGVYTWISDGTLLSFTVVDDACNDRRGVIAGGLWLKKP